MPNNSPSPAQPETKWISVTWISAKQQLPPYGVPVWVVYHGVTQHVAYSRDIGEWVAESGDSDNMPESFVSHWMHIIEAPHE